MKPFSKNTHARETRRRPGICLREKMTAVVLGALIVELPWYLGGMNITAQFVNLGLALLAFAALFVPLRDKTSPTVADNFKNLLKFPVFWMALVFLGYLLAQHLNPHLAFQQGVMNGKNVWWVEPVSHIAWLPSGLKSPYYPMNALRFLVMWATPLAVMCVCKIGIKRRRTWTALLWLCVANACAMCVVGFAVRASGSTKILWLVEAARYKFFGSFVYPNHAGMFLYLNLALALSLFLNMRKNALEGGDASGKHWLAVFPVIVLTAGGFATGSRIGLAVTLAMLAVALLAALAQSLHNGVGGVFKTVLGVACLGVIMLGGWYFIYHGKTPYSIERMRQLNIENSFEDRFRLIEMSYEVAREHPVGGWGAGSFSYVSQPYLKKYPGFTNPKKPGKLALYVRHSHCDWLEFPSDLGLLGCLPLAGIALYWLGAALRRARALPASAWMMLAGIFALGAHAAFDFPMACPAVQMMLALFLCAAAFQAKTETRTGRP